MVCGVHNRWREPLVDTMISCCGRFRLGTVKVPFCNGKDARASGTATRWQDLVILDAGHGGPGQTLGSADLTLGSVANIYTVCI